MKQTSAEAAIDWVERHNKVLSNIEWVGIYEALKAEIERLKKEKEL